MKTKYFEVSCIEELIGEETEYDTEYDLGWNAAINGIMKHVPQIDAVEVVRCKDCRTYLDGHCILYIRFQPLKDENDYCSDGVRKGKEHEDTGSRETDAL